MDSWTYMIKVSVTMVLLIMIIGVAMLLFSVFYRVGESEAVNLSESLETSIWDGYANRVVDRATGKTIARANKDKVSIVFGGTLSGGTSNGGYYIGGTVSGGTWLNDTSAIDSLRDISDSTGANTVHRRINNYFSSVGGRWRITVVHASTGVIILRFAPA